MKTDKHGVTTCSIPCPVYGWCLLMIIVSPDPEKTIKKIYKEDGKAAYTHLTGNVCKIFMSTKFPRVDIMHEAIHAAWFILHDSGVKLKPGNHEALTYLAGTIADWIYECKKQLSRRAKTARAETKQEEIT